MELAQTLLSQRWRQPGVRRVAEEAIISSARLVRAFANLDRGQQEVAAGHRAESARIGALVNRPCRHLLLLPRAESVRRRSRSPRRDQRPPPLRRSERAPELRAKSSARPPPAEEEENYSEESFEEEEEEEGEKDDRTEVKIDGGHQRPPEPEEPPVKHSSRPRGKKKKRRRHRGGTRHQHHYREAKDPFKRSHRKLRGAVLELATSARAGLERRTEGHLAP